MATWRERYWESKGRIKRGWIVAFKNREGRRQHVCFKTEAGAEDFCERVKEKEMQWNDERRAAAILGMSLEGV